ncbi:MAG: 4'-phosphopantetheinyl transferase superfamily protein [Clostridiaceae bacterium]|nr:4'-phosphopantetheinyl transferase superfamily protein [Clostridiaceae bacterium]
MTKPEYKQDFHYKVIRKRFNADFASKKNTGYVTVAAVNLVGTLEKSKYDKLLTYISVEKQKRINRFHRYQDAQRTLIGDILVRYLLCKRLGVRNKELIFGVNEYGKPFLVNSTDAEFNISHSGEWVVCSIDNMPVGIDIEQVKPIDISIAERFFSKEEVKSLMSKCIAEREAYFYDLWTLKESYIKAVGKGLSIPLNSFTIRIVKNNITVCSANETDNYYFKQYYIDQEYKMAVCSSKNEFPDEINFFNIDELYEELLLILI